MPQHQMRELRLVVNPNGKERASNNAETSSRRQTDYRRSLKMKRYQPTTARPLFAAAAAAMTILTIGALVVVPTHMERGAHGTPLAAATRNVPSATEVAITPARIDVVAVRASTKPLDRFRSFMDSKKQTG
jgi:hypothetical protein